MTEFDQYEDDETDTVIYGFNKLVKLLLECNSNTCEMGRKGHWVKEELLSRR